MTLAEINDKIRARLLDGTGRAVDDDTRNCVFRTEQGKKCAVGCLIPDSLYDPEMEESPVSCLTIRQGKWCSPNVWLPFEKLAEVLNASGIPATKKIQITLYEWQDRHDYENNWEGTKYIGPTSDPEV